jgi:energy-coupling factor transporter ATP-binding protein EcfA2
MERPIALTLQDVTVAYEHDGEVRRVLRGIDLDIAVGETIVLLGGNGSGKSTLLQVIAGLTGLSRGSITRRDEASIVPIVFQNPDAQIVGETVYEDICFGLENLAVPAEQMESRAKDALAAVGLSGYENVPIIQLSGGQKQLVCIASAIALQSPLLVFDEPTAMLDPSSRAHVLQILEQLKREGKTVVWSTQSLDEAGYADRVIVLREGMIAFTGTPEQFFYGEFPPCVELGFRMPYAIAVIHELQRRGLLTDSRPVREDECMEAVSRLCQ